MATLTAAARGHLRATARPRAGTITIQVTDAVTISMTPAEARELADDLALAVESIDKAAASAGAIRRAMAQAELPVAHA